MIPYDKRSGKIWYNGEFVDWSDVKVHVLSHGLHYASCVFEGERVYDGSIFKLEEHTSRLFYSAKRMGFEIPYSENEIKDDIVLMRLKLFHLVSIFSLSELNSVSDIFCKSVFSNNSLIGIFPLMVTMKTPNK